MKKTYIILFLFIFQIPALSSHAHLEKEYQKNWCITHNGKLEYKLPDSTRIDCLTSEYAIEFDFAPKWAESAGQSLYYALCSKRKPAVVLILENKDSDLKYLNRLLELAKFYNIKVWTMTPDDLLSVKN